MTTSISNALDLSALRDHQSRLENHPLLTNDLMTKKDQLARFMEHHVYCVWDFMCLVKGLQNKITPSRTPWLPTEFTKNGCARLINDIILTEESDVFEGRYVSHFDLYLEAMEEVGADTSAVKQFVRCIPTEGLYEAMATAPEPSRRFMESTFGFIETEKAHVMASAFAFGRETVIPGMYMNMVQKLGITESEAPKFYAWLRRHIEVDGEDHGPASVDLVNILCYDSPVLVAEAQEAGHKSIDDKMAFWDSVQKIVLV
jgi:hypothetical protein